jgi:hypothetical protein
VDKPFLAMHLYSLVKYSFIVVVHCKSTAGGLELLLKYGANAWRAQVAVYEGLLKQSEATLQGLRK